MTHQLERGIYSARNLHPRWGGINATLRFATLFLIFLLPAMGQSSGSKPAGKISKPQLRFICVSSLADEQEVVLASRNDKGDLIELGTVNLRSSFVSDELPATVGELHLALREEKTLKSICNFRYPADAHRALVALIADPEKNVYDAHVVDPEKLEFVKGSVLILNFSPHVSSVFLGPDEHKVEVGQRIVATPVMEDSGMYRLMVSHLDAGGKIVSCYDRYVSGNAKARYLLFLLPDKSLSMKVSRLPLFGEFE